MGADQFIPFTLLAMTLFLMGLWIRLIAFARLNRRLREALRRQPEEVAGLAAKLRQRPRTYDLLGWVILAAGAGLALLARPEGGGDGRPLFEVGIVTAITGAAVLLYIVAERRRAR